MTISMTMKISNDFCRANVCLFILELYRTKGILQGRRFLLFRTKCHFVCFTFPITYLINSLMDTGTLRDLNLDINYVFEKKIIIVILCNKGKRCQDNKQLKISK